MSTESADQRYEGLELIHTGEETLLHRGIRISDGVPVIRKSLRARHPAPEQRARIRHEFSLLTGFDSPNIVTALSLDSGDNGPVITLQDENLLTVRAQVSDTGMSMAEFLEFAVAAARSLEEIHASNVVHKDINPGNILWSKGQQRAQIIDFSHSSRLLREFRSGTDPAILEGTLAYLSPEQTGRTNRAIDWRSDLYSLGAAYYHALIGQPMFTAKDPMALIHAHLAIKPPLISDLRDDVPEVLAQLIDTLLAKSADDRYQSARGVRLDLEEVMRAFNTPTENSQAEQVILKYVSLTDRFELPSRLYGREEDLQLLGNAFLRAIDGRSNLVLVKGPAGSGKSALVAELHQTVSAHGGNFVTGKFDQFQRDTPYSGLMEATKMLLRQILASSEAQMQHWRQRILDALGTNGGLMIEQLPELALLIGPQPVPAVLSAEENRNRFNIALLRFFQSLSSASNPLLIFADDLQWADLGTLELLERLLAHQDTRGLLFVGAYRDSEVGLTHPLTALIGGLDQVGVHAQVIDPKPLTLADTINLISDATNQPAAICEELALHLHENSNGIPFFLREALVAAYEAGAIFFDTETSKFRWDIAAIRALPASTELRPIIKERLGRLPVATVSLLGLASCVGANFELKTLATIANRAANDLARELEPAFDAGLVMSMGAWHFGAPTEKGGHQEEDLASGQCRFVHDEIQASVYDLVSEDDKKLMHLSIARMLDTNDDVGVNPEGIFELVHQLTFALDLLVDDVEKLHFAKVFSDAAERAAGAAAFETVARLISLGLPLMGSEPWSNGYQQWLTMCRLGAEAAAISDNKAMLDELVQAVDAHAANELDRTATASAQMLYYYVAQGLPASALDVARTSLAGLGVHLPAKANAVHVGLAFAQTVFAMRGKSNEALRDLPEMTDPVKLAAMRILFSTISPAYIADTNMFPLIVLHMVRMSLAHGNSVESPHGFCTYAILISELLGQRDKAMDLALLSLDLSQKDPARTVLARVGLTIHVTLNHWKHHISESLPPLLDAHHTALEVGDIEFVCQSAWYYCNYITMSGETLDEVTRIQTELLAAIDEHKSEFHSVCGRIYHQLARNLSNQDPDEHRLVGAAFDERCDVERLIENDNGTGMFCFHHCRTVLSYLMGNFDEAIEHGLAAEQYEQNVLGSTNVAQHALYLALSLMAAYPSASLWERWRARRRIRDIRRKFRRWSLQGPANYGNKAEIIEGQWAKINHRTHDALKHFDSARVYSRRNRFLNDEALATELLARCEMDAGMELAAAETLESSWQAWRSWGCLAKSEQLEAEFPNLLASMANAPIENYATRHQTNSLRSAEDFSEHLDATSALKASQAIVEEMVLESLLEKLMRILIENAGAQAGALMLNNEGVPLQRAVGNVELDVYRNEDPGTSDSATMDVVQVPQSIVDYIWRSGQTIVLDNAVNDPRFSSDPLISNRLQLSVMAAPLEHRGRLVGGIYLENASAPAAFSSDRVELIQVLAAEAAISIQNAKLYSDLEKQAENLSELNQSLARFVPSQFLASLGHQSVRGVELGENLHREMSVLFSDIRGFTTLVEDLNPEEHVAFINEYLSFMEPAIVEAGGFVDSYIGDAIMALFDSADAAVAAALKMSENLELLNESRIQKQQPPLRIGMGISTGPLTLGTIGGPQRIKCGVIGDTVNLAARVESLTPTYGASLLISHYTKDRLGANVVSAMRQMERVTVKGQSAPVDLFEVLDAEPEEARRGKLRALPDWNEGIAAFYAKDFATASESFAKAASASTTDLAARRFMSSCWRYLDDGVPEDWDGLVHLDHK